MCWLEVAVGDQRKLAAIARIAEEPRTRAIGDDNERLVGNFVWRHVGIVLRNSGTAAFTEGFGVTRASAELRLPSL